MGAWRFDNYIMLSNTYFVYARNKEIEYVMKTTAGVLRQIKTICKNQKTCDTCPLNSLYWACCGSPQCWREEDIEQFADIIDDYEEAKDGNNAGND